MIVSLRGILRSAGPLSAVIETHGVGYEVHIPVTTAERLPNPGEEAFLHTTVVYREDSQTLYGFAEPTEREFFLLLVEKVTGIGPRIALSILSKLSIPVLQQAISQGDARLLAQCPGIGKKTAERMIIELRGSSSNLFTGAIPTASSNATDTGTPSPSGNRHSDAVAALITLGYNPTDSDRAVRKAIAGVAPEAPVEEIVRRALASR